MCLLLLLLWRIRTCVRVNEHEPFLSSATVSYLIVMDSSLLVSFSRAATFMISLACLERDLESRNASRCGRSTGNPRLVEEVFVLGERSSALKSLDRDGHIFVKEIRVELLELAMGGGLR